jgi:xylulokinase
MTRDLLLGVDVGTTQTKAAVFDLDGHLLAAGRAGYPLYADPQTNAAEQDPADWWAAAATAIGAAVAQVDANRLAAVSVGGQGPTVVALDGDRQPLARALTWMDLRATAEAAELGQRAGRPLPAYFFMPKVLWLKRARPEVYAAAQAFCQAWDFVAAQLTGELAVSSSAGIAPWHPELIEAGALDPAKFPEWRPMGERLGAVTPAAAHATGLPQGLPVVGGISDFFEGLIGSGAVRRGLACDNGGTSQGFSVCWDAPLAGEGLLKFPSFVAGQWYVGGPVSTTGKALDWWLTSVLNAAEGDYSALDDVAAVPPGSERLLFLPYLAGERAPIWDPEARGVFFGLSLAHGRAHLTRAILEAVAYTLCHLIDRFQAAGGEVLEIRACGGQARSALWCRLKADATGCMVAVPEVTDAPVLGAAIIAGVGAGVFDGFVAGAGQMARPCDVYRPDPERHARYAGLYAVYRDLYPSVRSLYSRLNSAG